ncbi:MAG: copper chaperone PCu(A)C [Gammaproteobacteria bacterium]|nr:copper chaperone PCu(A)C [Gammaproteobacteria bacterium]
MKKFFVNNLAVWMVIGLMTSAVSADTQSILVHEPWVREAPPNMKVLAAYLSLENTGSEPRVMTSVESPVCERIEIHNVVMEDGMAHMAEQEKLEIPPQSSVTLAPGGFHLMLMGSKQPLRAGDSVALTLHFKNGESILVKALVRKASGKMKNMKHSQHGKHH